MQENISGFFFAKRIFQNVLYARKTFPVVFLKKKDVSDCSLHFPVILYSNMLRVRLCYFILHKSCGLCHIVQDRISKW